MQSMATSKSMERVASAGLQELLKNPHRMRAAQGRVLMKVRLLKAAVESSIDPEQRRTLLAALEVFKKGVRAEIRRSASARDNEDYQRGLLMIEHECELDGALGG
jgi:hypothetical protein